MRGRSVKVDRTGTGTGSGTGPRQDEMEADVTGRTGRAGYNTQGILNVSQCNWSTLSLRPLSDRIDGCWGRYHRYRPGKCIDQVRATELHKPAMRAATASASATPACARDPGRVVLCSSRRRRRYRGRRCVLLRSARLEAGRGVHTA